jgi:hypothetical protein
MYTVTETEDFIAFASKIWDAEEREAFIVWIADHALDGDVIPGSGGLRKVRWSRAGMGKQGGARVIYYNRLANGDIVLLMAYTKAKFDNIHPDILKRLKEKLDA